nr:uncharacterized protein LOC123278865 isoform X2 [Equus asinus]
MTRDPWRRLRPRPRKGVPWGVSASLRRRQPQPQPACCTLAPPPQQASCGCGTGAGVAQPAGRQPAQDAPWLCAPAGGLGLRLSGFVTWKPGNKFGKKPLTRKRRPSPIERLHCWTEEPYCFIPFSWDIHK